MTNINRNDRNKRRGKKPWNVFSREKEIEKARKRIGGERGRQAGRHRGRKQARTRGRWFRSTRKVYGTQRCEITSRKHARLRHPNGYETCVCAHILRVSSRPSIDITVANYESYESHASCRRLRSNTRNMHNIVLPLRNFP